MAETIAGQVGILRKIAAGQSAERGKHVEKLKSAAASTAGQLEKVAGRYQKTAAALTAWVPALEHAQAQSLKALQQAQDAAGRQRASQPVQRPPGAKVTPSQQQGDQARARALAQANADLAAARAMLNGAVSYRDQQAAETAGRIDRAISDGVRDGILDDIGGFFSSAWGSFAHWVTQHAAIIKSIADISGWVASICGLLSLVVGWIPVIGWAVAAVLDTVALLATIVSLGCHLLLAATGNGSVMDVLLDVFALATFGAGRAFSKAAEGGYEAATAAARSPLVRSLGKAGAGLSRSDVTATANELTGFTAKEAARTVAAAKDGLSVPGWGAAVLHTPAAVGQDFAETFKVLLGRGAEEGGAAGKFQDLANAFPKARTLPSVVRWSSAAQSAASRYAITFRAGMAVDLTDKAASLFPDAPGLHQWNAVKDWAAIGGPPGG